MSWWQKINKEKKTSTRSTGRRTVRKTEEDDDEHVEVTANSSKRLAKFNKVTGKRKSRPPRVRAANPSMMDVWGDEDAKRQIRRESNYADGFDGSGEKGNNETHAEPLLDRVLAKRKRRGSVSTPSNSPTTNQNSEQEAVVEEVTKMYSQKPPRQAIENKHEREAGKVGGGLADFLNGPE